jgi:NAD+ diphosphatase
VRREVAEEVGVGVGAVDYLASQSWPFPASLMLGFQGRATTIDVVCHDGEIIEAAWFSRDELAEAMSAGVVALPPPASIAHRLVQDWYAPGDAAHARPGTGRLRIWEAGR